MTYSPEERDAHCDRILDGVAEGVSLKNLCADEGTPSVRLFNYWCAEDSQLYTRLRLARQEWAQNKLDEMIELLESPQGLMTAPEVQHLKLRVDTIKWAASKLLDAYNDKVQVQHSGTVDFSNTTDNELNGQLVQLIGALGEIVAKHDDHGDDR